MTGFGALPEGPSTALPRFQRSTDPRLSDALSIVAIMDPRPGARLGPVDEQTELLYLQAGMDPPWQRIKRNGVDVTDQPELHTPFERQQRETFEQRVNRCRTDGLIP